MKVAILPKTRKAVAAFILMIVSIVLFVVGSVLPAESDYSGVEIVIHNPIQAVITVIMFFSSVTALILGLISVIKEKERAVITFIVIILGIYNVFSFAGVIMNVLIVR